MNLLTHLENLLKQDERLISQDGYLLKNKVQEYAHKLDPELIGILLEDEKMREKFFITIKDVLVFDKEKFVKFVNNKEFLPDSYTAFKNKIGLVDSRDDFIADKNDVVLNRPYKDCVLAGGQDREDTKRDEIFYNEILGSDQIDRLLDPKVFTNFKRIDKDGEHELKEWTKDENGDIKDNLLIKGNNLLVLHSLKKKFANKVKLIYIDPPYNTGNDGFKYNDRFNHSTWLTFMKNRLEVAKELLKDDGVIFVQIDNKELHYLKVLMDTVFGRENFKNGIIVKKGSKNVQKQFDTVVSLNAGYDTILFYTKKDIRVKNLFKTLSEMKSGSWNNHRRGTDRPTMRYEIFGITPEKGQRRRSKERSHIAISNYKKIVEQAKKTGVDLDSLGQEEFDNYCRTNMLVDIPLLRLSRNNKPEHYIPPSQEVLLSENWMDLSIRGNSTEFEHEKNEEILGRIISWMTNPGDIVLDYHLGSGTTCAVAHKMGRQYIGIEQMDYIETVSLERMKKVIQGEQGGVSKEVERKGGGSFVYMELAQDNETYRQRISQTETKSDIVLLYKEIRDNAFINYKVNTDLIDDNIPEFEELSLEEMKQFLVNLLEQNALYINCSDNLHKKIDKEKNILFYL